MLHRLSYIARTCLLVSMILMAACKAQIRHFKGHWWVVEKSAGYIEFSMNDNKMLVCSKEFGTLYEGIFDVTKNSLIQYKSNDSTQIRLIGDILHFKNDTLILRYDTVTEVCVRISDSIPEIDTNGCFTGFGDRRRMFE